LFDKIKNLLKYYPEEDELPIDWCPLCEEKMSDNKRKTRIEHNKIKHPPDPKKKRKELRNNLIVIVLVGLLILSAVLFVNTMENRQGTIQWCIDQKDELNHYIRSEGVYPFDQQDRIDMLIENCDMVFGLGSYTFYNPPELP